jgi:lipopolysaccharide/colanic/teichoic acid biosynthesis glycosyltransferase
VWLWLFFHCKFDFSKIIFIQPRPGRNGEIFHLIKFKTMTDDRDASGKLLPDSLRLTKLGRFLRSSSFDELPQLINVLKGDMSLIGPRPLLASYLPLYNSRQMKRHKEKPGITGWAQINGRNELTWNDKFEQDLFYVENISFKLDFIIFMKTIKNVFNRTGISGEGTETMIPFKGNH